MGSATLGVCSGVCMNFRGDFSRHGAQRLARGRLFDFEEASSVATLLPVSSPACSLRLPLPARAIPTHPTDRLLLPPPALLQHEPRRLPGFRLGHAQIKFRDFGFSRRGYRFTRWRLDGCLGGRRPLPAVPRQAQTCSLCRAPTAPPLPDISAAIPRISPR